MTTSAISDDALMEIVAPYTKTGPERMAAMIAAVRKVDADGIDGDIVECGVWKAGNIILARKLSPDRVCWLYDTFDGMTEPTAEDVKRGGGKATDLWPVKTANGTQSWGDVSVAAVKSGLRACGVYKANKCRFVVGDICETLRESENVPERIAVLRLDTDWYASTKVELEVLFPRLTSGGVLIVDDYGHWLGARKAVDEYFAGQTINIEPIDYTGVMVVKT